MLQRELAVVYRPLAGLIEYARNARTHTDEQIAEIAASMREFGWTNPILIDDDGGIIAGHGRAMAAEKLKIGEVPCIVLTGLTPAQRRAYLLADNKIALNAGWDLAILASELKALKAEDFNLALTGFSLGELDDLIGSDAPVRIGKTDDDSSPALGPAVSRRGEMWLLGRHRVMCGDATDPDEMAMLVQIPEQADIVWTDPPYNVAYQGAAGSIANDDLAAEDFEKLLASAFETARGVLRAGGCVYVAHADTERQVFTATFRQHFKLAQVLIWVKNTAALSRQDYNWQHEPILYGWKEGAAHYFSGDFSQTTVIDDDLDLTKLKREELLAHLQQLKAAIQTTVLRHPRPTRSDLHPTMKPVALVQQCLRNSALEGQVVLDPFGGSGTTLIAAEKQGLKARLMELEPRYADVIVRRWEEFTGKRATLAGSGRSFGEVAKDRLTPTPDKEAAAPSEACE